jgi:hypothetical protein
VLHILSCVFRLFVLSGGTRRQSRGQF